jgi:ABC-type branched-subunit amino acid transport system permease subunit
MKNLAKRIRGWLPKQPNMPSTQQGLTQKVIAGYKRKIVWVLVCLIPGFVGGFLGALLRFPTTRLEDFLALIALIAVYITAVICGMTISRKRRKETQKKA